MKRNTGQKPKEAQIQDTFQQSISIFPTVKHSEAGSPSATSSYIIRSTLSKNTEKKITFMIPLFREETGWALSLTLV